MENAPEQDRLEGGSRLIAPHSAVLGWGLGPQDWMHSPGHTPARMRSTATCQQECPSSLSVPLNLTNLG